MKGRVPFSYPGGLTPNFGHAASEAAQAAARNAEEGMTVYRVWGGDSRPWSQYWTSVDPRTVDNYRDAAGLPDGNTGQFLMWGTLNNTNAVQSGIGAAPLHGNQGGLPEVQIPHPESQVDLQGVQGINPEF